MVQFTCWFSLHADLVYMLVQFTCWFNLQDDSVYMLVQLTCLPNLERFRFLLQVSIDVDSVAYNCHFYDFW